MELKELIGEELYLKVAEKLNGQQVIIAAKDEKYIKDDGSLVTVDKMNEVVTQRLSEGIEQRKILTESKELLLSELEELKSKNKGNKELQKTIDDMKLVIEQKDKDMIYTNKKSTLLNDLAKVFTHPELVVAQFNIDLLEVEGDSIKGFNELVSPVKEKYSELVGVKKPVEGDDGNAADTGEFTLTPQEKKAASDRGLSEEDYHGVLQKQKELKTNTVDKLNW